MENINKKKLHHNVFLGKTDYIPLLLYITSKEPSKITFWEAMNDPKKAIELYLKNNESTLKINSDRVMAIESNFLESLVPSMFGAQPYESAGGLIDAKPFINDINETVDMKVDDIFTGQMERALNHLRYLKEHPIENVSVLMSRVMSPLDYAVVMRGGDFYMDLALEPEICQSFMEKIADVTIKVVKTFKKELNEEMDSQITLRGVHFPGIRLTGDSIINLSPGMIEESIIPIFKKFADTFGNVMLHYCTRPAPSAHVLPVLKEYPYIKCVDNWHGYKTFFNDNGDGMDQTNISFCTDVPNEVAKDVEKLMSEPFFADVPRKGGRGIVVQAGAHHEEDAKKLYDNWVNYFLKKGINPQDY